MDWVIPEGRGWRVMGCGCRASRVAAFTLVEIMVVVAIIGLLAAIAIPSFQKARETSQLNACLNDLRIYQDALAQYALAAGGLVEISPAMAAPITGASSMLMHQ